MKFHRRQLLLGGVAAGITATTATDYRARQKQKKLEALAEQQLPQDQESLLKTAFETDAEKIFQGQKIIDSLELTPPNIPYNRELSKLLIEI